MRAKGAFVLITWESGITFCGFSQLKFEVVDHTIRTYVIIKMTQSPALGFDNHCLVIDTELDKLRDLSSTLNNVRSQWLYFVY